MSAAYIKTMYRDSLVKMRDDLMRNYNQPGAVVLTNLLKDVDSLAETEVLDIR